ncbi:hypothetical protein B0H66DRAFT_568105 [Apodospora peruviana]|uniref:AAA+ ATPase domain-containing protein n=1 Tax=Apodospora peruviana TaxID=516989 RepID=A0AAE0HX83_9PEZI|nr:hypothetical protein B0H66DRAFT_568105 [Apodospora peruviana]
MICHIRHIPRQAAHARPRFRFPSGTFNEFSISSVVHLSALFLSLLHSIAHTKHVKMSGMNFANANSPARPGRSPSPTGNGHGVDYTISADHSGGHAAFVESNYSQLAAKELSLSTGPNMQHNGALQDYQMQLMLCEQQNKKRLLMARQEQEQQISRLPSPYFAGIPNRADDRESSFEILTDDDFAGSDADGLEQSKRNKRKRRKVLETDAPAEPVVDQPVQEVPNTPPAALQHYLVLHRVSCTTGMHRCDRNVYLSEPHKIKIRGLVHLAGGDVVDDTDAYLSARPDTAFIVYRDYQCGDPSAVMRRTHSSSNSGTRFLRESITVESEQLHSALRAISKWAPNDEQDRRATGSSSTSTLLQTNLPNEYSHYFLYHHSHDIQRVAEETNETGIMALATFLRDCPDPMYEKCDTLFGQHLVSAETLPWLYQPNDVLVSAEGPLEIAYVLQLPARLRSNGVDLSVWNWGYDGHFLRRNFENPSVSMAQYGTIPIRQLAVYPLFYASEETKQTLLKTGEKFWSLRNCTHVSYQGPDYQGERIYPWDTRCMIDYETYHKFHPHAAAFSFGGHRSNVSFDMWPTELRKDTILTPLQTMLLPPGIHGFLLGEKKWVHLLVDRIRPISWNKEAFEKLVLPPRIKNLVKALVTVRAGTATTSNPNHPSTSTSNSSQLSGKRDDIIGGKGSGLIMLLHGGPGTGKTLTAESVAELAEMPLYSVTCGDIGTKPDAVEKYLASVLHLGKEWNCVLLLDEADVFLEERSLSDLERNSLVSVFLRTLEYYDGVLILTSNRVGTFDEAFKSRIQVALHYPVLDGPSREKIWRNFLGMLKEDQVDVDFGGIEAKMKELAGVQMNGRQIRNAITTARQLAVFEGDGTQLGWEHVEQAIETAGNFDRYLRDVHGHGDAEWARSNNLR